MGKKQKRVESIVLLLLSFLSVFFGFLLHLLLLLLFFFKTVSSSTPATSSSRVCLRFSSSSTATSCPDVSLHHLFFSPSLFFLAIHPRNTLRFMTQEKEQLSSSWIETEIELKRNFALFFGLFFGLSFAFSLSLCQFLTVHGPLLPLEDDLSFS